MEQLLRERSYRAYNVVESNVRTPKRLKRALTLAELSDLLKLVA